MLTEKNPIWSLSNFQQQAQSEYFPKFMAKHFIKQKTVIIKRIWKWTFNATWNMDINSLKELCGIFNPSFDTNLS